MRIGFDAHVLDAGPVDGRAPGSVVANGMNRAPTPR